MKKQKILIVIVTLAAISIVLLIASMTQLGQPFGKEGYPSGRDTYLSFGNGRVQIVWENTDSKYLYDCKGQKTLLSRIDSMAKR